MKNVKLKKDLLADLAAPQAGSSEVLNLFSDGGASGFSVHLIYDVLSFSAAACDSATNVFDKTDADHPSNFKKTNHGLITGLKVQVATSDTLPSGISALTDYYVIKIDSDYFQLASSQADAFTGTEVELDDAGTGTQTVTAVALAGASVTFQCSDDGVDFVNIQTATSITADGSLMLSVNPVSYQYLKVVKAITAGAVNISATIVVIGG